eukprot:6177411-Pleurochrysis_carterae.AAC.2
MEVSSQQEAFQNLPQQLLIGSSEHVPPYPARSVQPTRMLLDDCLSSLAQLKFSQSFLNFTLLTCACAGLILLLANLVICWTQCSARVAPLHSHSNVV